MHFYKIGRYGQSEQSLKQAFDLFTSRGPTQKRLAAGLDYAEILVLRSKYRKAVALFNKLSGENRPADGTGTRARIENDLGWAYSKMGANKTALAHYKKALPLALQAKDTLRTGYIYDNIGSIYSDWGNYKKSLAYRKKSLHHLNALHKPRDISITLNNIAGLYEHLFLYDKALDYYRQSLAIRKKIGDPHLLATIYNNMGGLNNKQGEYNQAIVNYHKSLMFSKKGENSAQTVKTLNNIGTVYQMLGQPRRALQYYRQSLQINKTFGGPEMMATLYKNIANRLRDLKRYPQADDYYQQALQLREKAGNPRKVGVSLLDLAALEKDRRRFPAAACYLQQARAIADSTGDYDLQERVYTLQGNLSFNRGDYTNARRYFKSALAYSQKLEKKARISPLVNLATTYEQLGSDSTLYYGLRAINLIEKLRTQAGALTHSKAGYFKQYYNFYIALAGWVLKYRHDEARAFRLVELAKARALTDKLVQAANEADQSLPDKTRLERAQQISDISALHMRLKRTHGANEKKRLKKKIRINELAHASFENHLQHKYPRYKKLKDTQPVLLQNVQRMCGSNTAILEYAMTSQKLIIFLITQHNVRVRQRLLSPAARGDSVASPLAQKVAQFRRAIVGHAPEDSIRALSKPLFDRLIAPFQRHLASFKNVIIVPDGPLTYLPFAALSHHHRYLIHQFNFKYTPSMTVYKKTPAPVRYAKTKLLAIARPSADSQAQTPQLPTAWMETKSISKLFPHATLLEGSRATEQQVKKLLQKNYSYIHIAAHSIIDEHHSALSGIILGANEPHRGIGNDGYLRSNEIFNLKIRSRLVVLSACKTGVGELINGEGLLGLQRAFLIAGTSTVVVSLWDVYDRPTTYFMDDFYKILLHDGANSWSSYWRSFERWIGWDHSVPFGSGAAAMRAAKLRMLGSARYHHPVYWAPFVVVGR